MLFSKEVLKELVLEQFTCSLHFFEQTWYLQVWHGEDYLSLGFLFGRKSRIAYVSDVSRFPIETEHGTVNLLHFLLIFLFVCDHSSEC